MPQLVVWLVWLVFKKKNAMQNSEVIIVVSLVYVSVAAEGEVIVVHSCCTPTLPGYLMETD